jgi:DNA-binding GntR family transcriptional regulator
MQRAGRAETFYDHDQRRDRAMTDLDLLPQTDGPRTTEEFVSDTLRKAILSGRMPIGSKIVQSDVAQQLGVSVTPVREALRALASERLVELDPHKGAVVRGLSVQDVRDLNFLRRAIEPEVMRRAVENITAADLDEAEAYQDLMRGELDPIRWSILNRQFHGVFLRAAQSELLTELLANLQNSYSPYIVARMMTHPEGMVQAAEDHDQILAATRAGDADLAIEWTIHHMRLAVRFTEELVEPAARTPDERRT